MQVSVLRRLRGTFMKKGFLITLIICMLISLTSCSWARVITAFSGSINKLTKKQWIEDIDYLKENLASKHFNVYHTLKKEDYEKEFSDLKKELPKLKDYEVAFRLSQIVATIGDAHTALYLGVENVNTRYPVDVEWFQDKLKVTAVDKDYEEIIGYNLTAINNIPIEEIIPKINTLISHENEQWLKASNTSYIPVPTVLAFLGVVKEDEAEFSFQDDKGNIMKLNLWPEKIDQTSFAYAEDQILQKPVSMQNDNVDPYNNVYWYKYIPEEKTMYFQYNQCIDRYIARRIGYEDYEKYPDFNKFAEDLIKELNDKEVDRLIIDLRNNTGGSSVLMSEFAVKLNRIKKLSNKGKVFVLTGKQTFSSGVLACMTLKSMTKAIFLGESTGGNVNGFGEIQDITLPNSKIQVSYSTKYIGISDEYKEGFIPDITIEQSFEDYIKGIDDVYEAVRNYYKKI